MKASSSMTYLFETCEFIRSYQHIADAGISGLVLIAYSLVSAGAASHLVGARRSQEKRLQLLCGVSPLLYWAAALVWDMMVSGMRFTSTLCKFTGIIRQKVIRNLRS